MDLRDPAPGTPWTPQQFWVCPKCGRHFWTTHPPPAKDKPAAEPAKDKLSAQPAQPGVEGPQPAAASS